MPTKHWGKINNTHIIIFKINNKTQKRYMQYINTHGHFRHSIAQRFFVVPRGMSLEGLAHLWLLYRT